MQVQKFKLINSLYNVSIENCFFVFQTSIGLPLMLFAWTVTEIIRYSYYTLNLVILLLLLSSSTDIFNFNTWYSCNTNTDIFNFFFSYILNLLTLVMLDDILNPFLQLIFFSEILTVHYLFYSAVF